MSGNNICRRSMMLSSRMGHGSSWILHGIKPIGCRWVYKNTYKLDGSLYKYKVRLVAKSICT
jgi:hypothetical protein